MDNNYNNYDNLENENYKRVIFGAGCFWGIQEIFDKTPGVVDTTVGYAGGNLKNPSYEEVCSHTTGHIEVVDVIFDETKISFEELLEVFWNSHDPTSVDRQNFDIGEQYRSVIFYFDENQKKIIYESLKKKEKEINKKIVTQISEFKNYFKAEEYHQKFYKNHKFRCH